ncbi:MAG: transglycosylase SLT domain-containing protein, partial [Candidatus Palauibacterales bacterium]|nr:transglycosylase SLT domain-containing protein [Candidatus Palauibacterales bacterium]
RLGTGYLTELIDRFDGTLAFALAAYNAGPHRMSRWSRRDYAKNLDVFMEGIPFRQTRHYVKAVQAHARIYAALYGCGGSGADRYEPCLGRQASLELRPSRRPASGLSRQ